jgi:hypothetical protein
LNIRRLMLEQTFRLSREKIGGAVFKVSPLARVLDRAIARLV